LHYLLIEALVAHLMQKRNKKMSQSEI